MAKVRRINLTLPEGLAKYVTENVEDGRFASEADFIRQALRDHQDRSSAFDLDAYIQAGIDSGPSGETPEAVHERLRNQIRAVSMDKKVNTNNN